MMIKKIIRIALSCFMICGFSMNTVEAESPKTLVIYFSRVGNTNFKKVTDTDSSASIVLEQNKIKGNAQVLAEYAQELTDGDLVEIQTEKKYPADYDKTCSQAKEEKQLKQEPAVTTKINNLNAYERIIIIYPLWWSNVPRPVVSFLHENDIREVDVYPIVTHAGSGASDSADEIKALCSNAKNVKDPLAIDGNDVLDSKKQIKAFIDR